MSHTNRGLPPQYGLLVSGSLNAKEEDREHEGRSWLRPVQVVLDDVALPCRFFDSWGELGVSAFAFTGGPADPFFVTTGSDLFQVQLNAEGSQKIRVEPVDIPHLLDVHEITLVDEMLWIANTGRDEIISYDIRSRAVTDRISLSQYKTIGTALRNIPASRPEEQTLDRFHCNQAFQSHDGRILALVHHVNGRQPFLKLAKKLLKKHGNGGILDITNGTRIPLSLKGPHSVRHVGGEYWVCDSGMSTLRVYDEDWEPIAALKTAGWGRGADYSVDHDIYCVASSAHRKRYRNRQDYNPHNLVEIFSIKEKQLLGRVRIPDGLEQINNVYLIDRAFAEALLNLSADDGITSPPAFLHDG